MIDDEIRRLERAAREQDREAWERLGAVRRRVRDPRPPRTAPPSRPPRRDPGSELGTYEWRGKVYSEVEARMLWSLSHYDGAMTGIARYDGRTCYAVCHQGVLARPPRYFWLYELAVDEVAREAAYQEMFRSWYGLHCDYEDDGATRKVGGPTRGWRPGPWRRAWLSVLSLIGRAAGAAPEDAARPSYETLRAWAGIDERDRLAYREREALGFFRLRR